MKTDPTSAAYPIVLSNPEMDFTAGLTKREYFAALFTASFISCPGNKQPNFVEENAEIGLKQADALITALNKEKS